MKYNQASLRLNGKQQFLRPQFTNMIKMDDKTFCKVLIFLMISVHNFYDQLFFQANFASSYFYAYGRPSKLLLNRPFSCLWLIVKDDHGKSEIHILARLAEDFSTHNELLCHFHSHIINLLICIHN